ncbi:MAG: dTMP kinase [Legionellaceae bacterium]|nr:dTMP kinase [Legionellaceae bacterium]
MSGQFIVVEGLEGAGKSTVVLALKTFLENQGLDVLTIREPGGTGLGEAVRTWLCHTEESTPLDARTELLLFYAARVQLIQERILPALKRGQWVLADRFEWSTFAYQGGGRGIDNTIIQALSRFCVGDCQPDCIFYLDIPAEVGLQRIQKRGALDRIEQEPLAFFKKIEQSYKNLLHAALAHKTPSSAKQVYCINAALSESEVCHEVLEKMRHWLQLSATPT